MSRVENYNIVKNLQEIIKVKVKERIHDRLSDGIIYDTIINMMYDLLKVLVDDVITALLEEFQKEIIEDSSHIEDYMDSSMYDFRDRLVAQIDNTSLHTVDSMLDILDICKQIECYINVEFIDNILYNREIEEFLKLKIKENLI